MFDFHCHSNHSDGDLSPSELILLAKKKKLSAISLTDHDSVSGIEEARIHGVKYGITIFPGVELSLGFMNSEIHLLGYNFDHTSEKFLNDLSKYQTVRLDRNLRMIDKMRANGLQVHYDDILEIAHGEFPGRPHFAQYLIRKGLVKSVKEAFDKYLAKDRPFFSPRNFISLEEGITMITDAGGIPAVAHPLSLNISWSRLAGYMPIWKEMGIRGIEGYYPEHSEGKCLRLIEEAKKYDFLITAGSDFHGKSKANSQLGRTCGNRKIDKDMISDFLMELSYSPIISP